MLLLEIPDAFSVPYPTSVAPAARNQSASVAAAAALQAVSGFTSPEVLKEITKRGQQVGDSNSGGGPLAMFLAPLTRLLQRTSSDPFYAVIAYRNFRRE